MASDDLKTKKLFIVPVGEPEKWIIKALDEIHKDNIPNGLKDFIKDVLERMGENVS